MSIRPCEDHSGATRSRTSVSRFTISWAVRSLTSCQRSARSARVCAPARGAFIRPYIAPTAPPSAAPITNATVCRSFAIAKPPLRRRPGGFLSAVCTSSCHASHAWLRSSRKWTGAGRRPGGNLRRVDLLGEERSEAPVALSRRLVQPARDQLVSDVVGEDVGTPEWIGDESQSLSCFRLRYQAVALEVGDYILWIPALVME